MSVHKVKISNGWELGSFSYAKFNRWYRYFGDWKIADGKLIGSKTGDWFQAMAHPNCAPTGDYSFSCKFTLKEGSLARINLNYEPRRLTKYTVQFKPGGKTDIFYVFQELYDHAVVSGCGPELEADREYSFRAERTGNSVRVFLDEEEIAAFEADCPCGRFTAVAVLNGETYFSDVAIKDAVTGDALFTDDFTEDFCDYAELEYGDLAVEEWIPAEIPGSVQSALLNAGKIKDPFYGYDGGDQMWVDDRVWVYRKTFTVPEDKKDKPCRLVFDGVDYKYFVFVNGNRIAYHEGMYGSEYEINEWLNEEGENEIVVCLLPIAALAGHAVVRPYIFHRWHFNMDVVPMGIWRDVWLDFYDKVYLLEPQVVTKKIQGDKATLELSVTLVNMSLWPYEIKGKWILTSPKAEDEDTVVEFTPGFCNGSIRITKTVEIDNARLWWPNGMGKQNLYGVKIECDLYQYSKSKNPIGHDEISFKTGIRIVRMISEPTAHLPEYPLKVPNTRLNGEWTWCFSVNGKPFYAKGSNWMPVDQMYRLSRDKYERILLAAKEGNLNMLRPWGGGLFETENFFELCDEYGLCVWQELPMSCGYYHNTDLNVWKDTVKRNIMRLRNHPSLTTWSGGNEIDPDCKENKPIIDLTANLISEYDDKREFRRACPYGGDNHSYVVNWQGQADYSKYRLDVSPAITEYSMASPIALSSLKKVMTEEDFNRWPLPFPDNLEAFDYAEWADGKREETSFSLHDAHLNSVVSKMIAPMSDCGMPKNLEEFVRYMQTAHGLLLQYGNDWFRSRWPDCTASMSWTFNAPEPNTLCWSIVDYYGVPKRAYYYQKRSYEPLHAVATGFDVAMVPGETFRAKLAVINETAEELGILTLGVRLMDSAFHPLCEDIREVDVKAEQVNLGGYFTYEVPEDAKETTAFLVVELKREGEIIARSVYCPRVGEYSDKVKFYKNGPHIADVERNRTALAVSLQEESGRTVVAVKNVGDLPAYEVALSAEEEYLYSDNYFWLGVGESKKITCFGAPKKLIAKAWNTDAAEGGLGDADAVGEEKERENGTKKKAGGKKV